MRVIRVRNVNDAFYESMHLLDEFGVREDSRAGPVSVAPWPVMTVYENPRERVLFDEKRDANPFFHLMEGLWMLAGRNDAAFLNHYVRDFGARFAEPDGVIHDAYGYRWRRHLGYDQLDEIVRRLQADPKDRQAVLQMWDAAGHDVMDADDLCGDWRARPCNTHAYFRVNGGMLDMTICCRSNDAIWGAHGANAVHFSMLLEYLAGRLGVQVGTLYQLSNNYHGYADALEKIGDPTHLDGVDPYELGDVYQLAMGTNWKTWDADLARFIEWHDVLWTTGDRSSAIAGLDNAWFVTVAARVALARYHWINACKPTARQYAEGIAAPDWRRACLEWMDRRSSK